MDQTVPDGSTPLKMSVWDSARFFFQVALPTWSKGIIIRRPFMVSLAERFGWDSGAVRCMQTLRAKYGAKPLLVRNPFRPQILLLAGEDVAQVLDGTPDPFSPASSEKRAALQHFEPHNSLISRGAERAPRRAFHDAALQSAHPVHGLGEVFAHVARQESRFLMKKAAARGVLDWTSFSDAWFRIVRRVVLGSAAGGDRDLTQGLAHLRNRGNWAFLAPQRKRLRRRFHEHLAAYLDRAEPGSLAGYAAGLRAPPEVQAADQVAQWLFAFDPAGMTAFRALALLVSHPDRLERARTEIAAGGNWTDLPFLRAAIVETVRLYPTTPMILRQTARLARLGGLLPAGAGVAIYTPFFHRDTERLEDADRFAPEFWLLKDPVGAPPLVPFSAGPASCPARHLVPMLASMVLAAILHEHELAIMQPGWLGPGRPLKGTLNNYALRFRVRERNASRRAANTQDRVRPGLG